MESLEQGQGAGLIGGDGRGSAKTWKTAKLLFVSTDTQEVTQTVKWLLRSGIRCEVRRERWNSCHGVWLQDERDFPKALRIWMLYSKPRPLPAWASVLESIAPESAPARSAEGRGSTAEGLAKGDPGPAGAQADRVPGSASRAARGQGAPGRGVDGVWLIPEE